MDTTAQALALVEQGWSAEAALAHVEGNCDRMVCSGDHSVTTATRCKCGRLMADPIHDMPSANAFHHIAEPAATVSTDGATQMLCGEHGAPVKGASATTTMRCDKGCEIAPSDVMEEVGTVVEAHEGNVYVVDLTGPSAVGERRGYDHTAYVLAYGGQHSDDGAGMAPRYILDHFSSAVRTAFEQGWERGAVEAREDDKAQG